MRNKSEHINLIKVIATILVVYAHSTRMYTGESVVTPQIQSLVLSQITKIIYSFHMPLYMAISGIVYGICIDDLKKYNNTLNFINNKFVRLMIPYVFWGLLYVAPTMTYYNFVDLGYFDYCYKGIILAINPRHLWFLLVLFEIFFVFGLLRKIISNNKIIIVLLPLLALICCYSQNVTLCFQLRNLCYYLFFFYIGYLYNKKYIEITAIISNPCGITALFCLFIISYKFRIYMVGQVIAALCGSSLIVAISSFFPSKIMESNVVRRANKNGFGIYIWHPIIIYILYYYLGDVSLNPFLLSFVIALIAYVFSWILTEFLRCIGLGVLLGETR